MNSYQPAHGAWVKHNIKQQSWCNVRKTTLSKIYQANVQHARLSDSYPIDFFIKHCTAKIPQIYVPDR